MKTIKLWFSDFWIGFDIKDNFIISLLSTRYKIELTKKPDYLIYSSYGCSFVNFDCIRIFYTGEPHAPNFNVCDYAIGYEILDFGDRYLRWPYYRIYRNELIERYQEVDFNNKGFCSYIYSNKYTSTNRSEFMRKLSSYKNVSGGGKDENNIGYFVNDKHQFLSKYRFSIVFENSIYDGYTSEKIVDAFHAATIPIYFGNSKIDLDINKEAIINAHDFDSMDDLVDFVMKLDNDEEKYITILNSEKYIDYDESILSKFLFNILDQGLNEAIRRPIGYYSGIELLNYKFRSKIDYILDLIHPSVKYKTIYNGKKILRSQRKKLW
jgi:alpha(1,3/1,4) fucosyltransferase